MDDYISNVILRPDKEIIVQPFSQRINAWPDDDWSGIGDSKQRRRLQNRVNQRAKRKSSPRQSTNEMGFWLTVSSVPLGLRNKAPSSLPAETTKSTHEEFSIVEQEQYSIAKSDTAHRRNEQNEWLPAAHATVNPATLISLESIDSVRILEPDSPKTKTTIKRLEMMAYQCYMLGSPRTDLLFNLYQLNFTRALMENIRILGLTSDNLHDDAVSPFNTAGPRQYGFEQFIPTDLRPTVVQRSVLHHPWLDLLPDPQMRDNLILAEGMFDEEQLCLDMKGAGSVRSGNTGIIVWKDPWDPSGWEVTEKFARSWGWIIWNCHDLLKSTNYWRAKRNEKPLFWTKWVRPGALAILYSN